MGKSNIISDKINSAKDQSNECLSMMRLEANSVWNSFKKSIDEATVPNDFVQKSIMECNQLLNTYENEGGRLAYSSCLIRLLL